MLLDGSLLGRGPCTSPEVLCEEGSLAERDQAVWGQGSDWAAPGSVGSLGAGSVQEGPLGRRTSGQSP